MDISLKLQQLDRLFQQKKIEQAGTFLENSIQEAQREGDSASLITLLNEMIGYCRDTGKYEASRAYSKKVLDVLDREGLSGTVPYATTLLNVANAARAAGDHEKSLECYDRVFEIYAGNVESTDYRYAALYNNLSLLYQEMGDFEKAAEALEKALPIISLYKEERIALAVTHSNLAQSLLRLNRDAEAVRHLEQAFAVFEQDEEKDYHYSAALCAMGEVQFRAGEYCAAAQFYEKALAELESHVGRTPAYDTIKENLEQVYRKIEEQKDLSDKPVAKKERKKGLILCRDFYEAYGRPMIKEKFPEYESRIVVGLVGEGSDCFGFDDAYSEDHDFGPGFCLWLDECDYQSIGKQLQEAYESLPESFEGKKRIIMPHGKGRTGVFSITDFYRGLLGGVNPPESGVNGEASEWTEAAWQMVEEWRLAAAVNGSVFRDDLGLFSEIRARLLAYYPDTVWKKKIAAELILMAQTGQYNYERMLKRGEKVTAELVLSDYVKHTMQLVYLLNRTYAPYYKWLHHGMKGLVHLPEIMDILRAVYDMPKEDERIPMVIEIVAKLVIGKLKELKLVSENALPEEETYLEAYADEILRDI